MENKTYEAKVITLGDSMVGKTCLILRFLEDTFFSTYLSTIGFDLKQKVVKLDTGEKMKLIIHDTAGQERFKSLSVNYIKKANGILIVYDITNKQSFVNIENWVKCAKEEMTKEIPIYLIGNKCDLEESRVIQREDGENLATQFGTKFYETSCKTGEGVEKCFTDLAVDMFNLIKKKGHSGNSDDDKNVIINNSKKKKKCC
jgi:Ras-related protein Rab-8A